MLVSQLKDLNLKEHVDFYIYNNTLIRVGIDAHFTREELTAYQNKKFQFNYADSPLSFLTTPSKIEKRNLRSYAYTLAFARRITLPLAESMVIPTSYTNYPIYELYNFQYLQTIFEKYYPDFSKIDANNIDKKTAFNKEVTQIVFKLWLAGYGLLPNLTHNTVDDELLNSLKNFSKNEDGKGKSKRNGIIKITRFLGFALSKESDSHVSCIPVVKQITSLKDREIGKWNTILETYPTEITKELYSFCFDILRSRINNNSIFEYTDDTGTLQRQSLGLITDGTWVRYSGALISLCEILNSNGYPTINECIEKGLFDIMTTIVSKLSKNVKSNIRITCRSWLDYYTKKNSLKININRIVPFSVRNEESVFGKIFDYGAAIMLIETLLDDSSGYFDETNLMDYRMRRACLLELATGQRITSICYLLRDCIKPDQMNTSWIVFHKTKNHSSNKVIATPDILKWIKELKSVAPANKIFISSKLFDAGDDLNEYRLFANQYNDGALAGTTVNFWLKTLQEKIWEGKHPNKVPFTTHDLRRMHAVYMKLNSRSNVDIQEQLGQSNINSQIPYLHTQPVAHQKHFKDIQKKGIYSIIDDESIISLDNVLDTVSELNDDRFDATKITQLLLDASNEVDDFEVPEAQNAPLPSGFPIRMNSCNATMLTNCGHTELHCFKCSHYKPEINSLDDHKTEVFRYMVLVLFQDKSLKKTKDEIERTFITIRSSELNSLIDECFTNLFSKFNLRPDESSNIREDLTDKANKYIKKYFTKNPSPSFIQAKNFLMVGDING